METQKKNNDFHFTVFLHNFLYTLPHLIWVPLLLCVLAAGYRFYNARRSYSPAYETFAVYRVSANRAGSIDLNSYRYYLDANAANKIAATYRYAMESDQAKKLMQEKYGVSSLPASVSCRVEATMLILTSRASTPQRAVDGLHMAAEIFPEASYSILGNFTLEVFDEAQVPDSPVTPPDFIRPTVRWGLAGLAIGLVLIGIFAGFRKTVHNSEDLHDLLNVPCLGLLPQVRFKARTGANRSVLLTNPKLDEGYIEAVRAVRFQLHKELEHQRAKIIMVTSTIPGEGKSTLSANLALSLAEQGSRVTLVDCDLRKQNLKELFGVKKPTRGLVELIAAHDKDLEGALTEVEGSKLRLLSGDKIAEQPQNFLSSPRLKHVMNALRKYSDFVIVDTPPSGLLSDAASLSQWVDGVIYVVRQDYVGQSAVLNSVSALNGMEVRFLGCVLNQTIRTTSASGYGYSNRRGSGYGYAYGYGKGYGYGKKHGKSDRTQEESEPYSK